ncbi:hypothetical protein B0J11DRAFT_392746, partial [Dendryphion nanum]
MVAQPDPDQVTHPLDVAQRALQVGGVVAIPGTIVGAISGTLKTRTPILFAIFSGIQCFAIGTTYWGTRTTLLNQDGLANWWNSTRGIPLSPRNDQSPSHSDKIRASTISGAFTGASLGILMRGPQNVIPGTIMFTLFGYGGQHAYDILDRWNSKEVQKEAVRRVQVEKDRREGKEEENWLQRIAKSKWSPLTELTDDQYADYLGEKLLAIEASIAVIDDKIEVLRK